ncbi:DUF6198 family protein [Clostridium sp. AM58-1XD]|uniref:YczE/YyaS/YitT family protein n=1 Tax=Clostridium sp. AM58-1XD TaxID=2292307 RepID=UPI000E4BAADC|nr:DUF6198 family protein [Clostridium sp. AM58-1XD]RGY99706.1 hypothetical protein DXA13_07450 [Clostridium sp. AM58-1XD]
MKKLYRFVIYAAGLLILALGITLNTKTGLGVSPIISVSYSISYVWNLNFGDTTLALYTLFVIAEFVMRGRRARPADVLQIPLSIVFTRFLNLFAAVLPDGPQVLWQQFLLLLAAIVLTGIGAAMSVNMRLIPNPGDGIVQTISDCTGREMGLVKNVFDVGNIMITACVGFFSGHPFVGIGAGTVVAVIGVGRVVSVFNRCCKSQMDEMAGISYSKGNGENVDADEEFA